MKLWGTCIVQNSRPSSNVGVTAPTGVHNPKNMTFCSVVTHDAKRKQSHASRQNVASDAVCA